MSAATTASSSVEANNDGTSERLICRTFGRFLALGRQVPEGGRGDGLHHQDSWVLRKEALLREQSVYEEPQCHPEELVNCLSDALLRKYFPLVAPQKSEDTDTSASTDFLPETQSLDGGDDGDDRKDFFADLKYTEESEEDVGEGEEQEVHRKMLVEIHINHAMDSVVERMLGRRSGSKKSKLKS